MEESYLKNLDPREKVNDFPLMISTVISFLITVTLLFLHRKLNLPVGLVGLIGASLALILSGKKMEHIWGLIEWEVLVFFSTLFIIVGSLEKTNVIASLSKAIVSATSGNTTLLKGVLLWLSAIISGFIDNVPFAASMVPVLKNIISLEINISLVSLGLLVAFGVDVGGNFTPIGASANVVGITMLSKAGIEITWKDYLKVIVPITLLNILIACFAFLIFFK
jgi:Na+/H+ antiporter NhaD/arsenite permease-like protein